MIYLLLVGITNLSTKRVPMYMYFWVSFLFPLGGVFNVLVFTRPQVVSLRRRKPHYSRIQAFWIVVKNGGEAPNEVDEDVTRKKNPRGNSIVKSDQEGDNSSVLFAVNQMSDSPMISSSSYGLGASAAAVNGERIPFGNNHAQFRKSSEREFVSVGHVIAQHIELSTDVSNADDCSGPSTNDFPPVLPQDAGIYVDDYEDDLSVEVEEDRDRDIWDHAFTRIRKMRSEVISVFSIGSHSSCDGERGGF